MDNFVSLVRCVVPPGAQTPLGPVKRPRFGAHLAAGAVQQISWIWSELEAPTGNAHQGPSLG